MSKSKASKDYQRGYYRGLIAARERLWPENKPPIPPHEQVACLMRFAEALRDAVDGQLATFDPDDPMVIELYKYVGAVDEAMAAITQFALTKSP